jgi:hypothetical protein
MPAQDGSGDLVHSDEEEAIVAAQLGRPVRGRWRVARRCHLGVPMVIENHPRLDDGTPFPTLFWLSCPVLVKRVGGLEAGGAMAAVSARLEAAPERARLVRALARYRSRRDAREVVGDSGAPPGGGPERVKCLHAHVAQELADGPNPVGSWALAATGWPDCALACVTVAR